MLGSWRGDLSHPRLQPPSEVFWPHEDQEHGPSFIELVFGSNHCWVPSGASDVPMGLLIGKSTAALTSQELEASSGHTVHA